jgi:integrase
MARGKKSVIPAVDRRSSGGWRVRWRQEERQPDGSTLRRQRSVTAASEGEARSLANRIEEALREQGYWDPQRPVPAKPVDKRLEAAAAEHMEVRSIRWGSAATVASAQGEYKRFLSALRDAVGLPAGHHLSLHHLRLGAFRKAVTVLQSSYAESTAYYSAARGLALWRYLAALDDTHVETPPFEDAEVLPPTPIMVAPDINPTWSDTDHCLNRIRLPTPLRLATIMRYTGLRIGQAAAIHREHLDLEDHTLHVATGKSRREKAAARTVPVSPHLLDDLGPWLATLPEVGPLFPCTDPSMPMPSPRNQTRYVTEAWKKATADRVVKQAVWLPRNRKQARPDHAFRAAIQSELMEAGVPSHVLDRLVGHTEKSTRLRHYATPSMDSQRAAVGRIPRVRWTEAALDTARHGTHRRKPR